MNSANKVGEIFNAAGQAFSRLGDLTMQLHPNAESPIGKWTEEDINQLHDTVMRFSDDLHKISSSIKNRTVSQIRQTLKKKAFEEAGIPAKQVPVVQSGTEANLTEEIMSNNNNSIKTETETQTTGQPATKPVVMAAQQLMKTVQIQQQPRIISTLPPLANANNQLGQQQQQQQLKRVQASPTESSQTPPVSSPASLLTSPTTIHLQPLQQIVPVSQTMVNSNTSNPAQLIQTNAKQIIIRQQALTPSGGGQLAQPQILHLQPHQLQQLQQQSQILQTGLANAKIAGATTVTLQQFQQLQMQKALLAANVLSPANANTASQSQQQQQQQQALLKAKSNAIVSSVQSTLLPMINASNNNAVLKVTAASTANNCTSKLTMLEHSPIVVSSQNSSAMSPKKSATALDTSPTPPPTSVALKSGPDVTMTLNRINTQGNEVDGGEECLPADVVKLEFASEEVAG